MELHYVQLVNLIKYSKITHEIAICRDAISLNTEKKQRV